MGVVVMRQGSPPGKFDFADLDKTAVWGGVALILTAIGPKALELLETYSGAWSWLIVPAVVAIGKAIYQRARDNRE